MTEKKEPEQIPWATNIKVKYQSDLSIALEKGNKINTADIWHKDFEWSVAINSKIMVDEYMTLDDRLTGSIQKYWDSYEGSNTYRDRIMGWLKGEARGAVLPRVGPKEWRPPSKKREKSWKLADYGYGNTYNEDNSYWWGDVFEYAHFMTDEGDEGVVIMWQGGGDPRGNYYSPMVYMGNFEEFMSMQHEGDPYSVETFLHWNRIFENGFMWAWEKLGVFDDGGEQIEDMKDKHVNQVLEAIEKDPSILLPESVQKIIDRFDDFPKQIQNAVTWLMRNHRRDLEKALGQRLLWGDLYGE
jgi:hypothetical protein